LQGIIGEAVEELRQDIIESVNNIHIDMLRQFQMQSDEMKSLILEQGNMVKHLMEENRSLREENEQMRSAF